MKIKMLSAGVVVVRKENGNCLYLLLRAYQYWDFPKGLVEPNEGPYDAAHREVKEETGIESLEFRWGRQYKETEPYGRGKVARFYLALSQESKVVLPVSLELGRPEHHEYRWVTYREGLELLVERLQPILQWAHQVTGCS